MAATPIARLALPFTDADMVGHVDVRITVAGAPSTVTIGLPSVDGVDGAYYTGGDLGTATTATFSQPHDSLIMALAMAIATVAGPIIVSEDVLLPGRYRLYAPGVTWEILWDDPLTTADAGWFGFAAREVLSDVLGFLHADYQADRLWIARHPRWNRKKRVREGSLIHGYSDDDPPQARLLGNGRTPWQLFFSVVSGARVYLWDAQDVLLAAHVSGAVAGAVAVSATVVDGGTGYTPGQTLTVVGGTAVAAAELDITAALTPPGPVTEVSVSDIPDDIYTDRPLNPVATTSNGPGTGCTLDVTWAKGDPNICFQSLWEWIATRLPIKVIEDDTRLVEFEYADPDSTKLLGDLDTVVRSTRTEAPPFYEVLIPLSVRPSS